jgi:hypothetical protein
MNNPSKLIELSVHKTLGRVAFRVSLSPCCRSSNKPRLCLRTQRDPSNIFWLNTRKIVKRGHKNRPHPQQRHALHPQKSRSPILRTQYPENNWASSGADYIIESRGKFTTATLASVHIHAATRREPWFQHQAKMCIHSYSVLIILIICRTRTVPPSGAVSGDQGQGFLPYRGSRLLQFKQIRAFSLCHIIWNCGRDQKLLAVRAAWQTVLRR